MKITRLDTAFVVFFVWMMVLCTAPVYYASAQPADNEVTSDPASDSRLPTGRVIRPAGEVITFYGRPVDLELSTAGDHLFVKDWKSLRVIDAATFEPIHEVAAPGNASLFGIAKTRDDQVLFTNAKGDLLIFAPSKDGSGKSELRTSIPLAVDSFPCGVAISPDDTTAYICLSKKNTIAIVDLKAGKVTKQIPVGVAPFDVVLDSQSNRLFVSNIGGRRAQPDDQTAPSAGTDTVVDERGVASTGTISVIDLNRQEVSKTISVGLHPSVLIQTGDSTWACLTNQDEVIQISKDAEIARRVVTKPTEELPFGSMPNALAVSPDGKSLFVALAGNNGVAVFDLGNQSKLQGVIPTAWFPSGLQCSEEYLFVACTKGIGSRSQRKPVAEGRNSHDHRGVIQRIKLSDIRNQDQLAKWTAEVIRNSRLIQAARNSALDENRNQPAEEVAARPIPNRLGEPSVFKHVIYVIKENRTFDQVFGDMKEARSEKSLCVFPEEITPNHHALARRFGILDNYYCNGVLSADGHSWATEGNVTPYLERAFGGFARSYTFGDDPITYSSSGFLWDRILSAGLTFRNYGEMDYATPPDGMKYQEIWQALVDNKEITFEQNIGIERLRRYSCRDYPGWNMVIPDVLRMDRFLKEFREFEKNGDLPNLCIVYLPQDHLGGGVTSRAHMADNDLALGRLVEAVSNSTFWKNTVVFVNEDDPQNGYDHIDGHRSLCLVISAYSRSGVNHSFYNQTSVLRTMLHIFGLPPMNQQDASSPLMTDCFAMSPINSQPYKAIPANFDLNETPKPKSEQSEVERRWRDILATVPIHRTGLKTPTDEDNLNRFIWHELKGWTTPYPVDLAGAHGSGLERYGLVHGGESED